MDRLAKRLDGVSPIAVGHRIVHGGEKYGAPSLIDDTLIAELVRLSPFDPEHLPEELLLIEAFRQRFPDVPQIACFDTAFHRDLPRVARLLPLPVRYEAMGLRRFGFHGISLEYLSGELARLDGGTAAMGRVIYAHLGAGASLTAVHGGRSLETTMGFTPTGGLPMATRSGDLDPGIFRFLAVAEGFDAKRFDQMVNFESGLLGVSDLSGDMKDLLSCAATNARAAEAIAYFVFQVKKAIGALAAVLGGIDALVFSGGIGERAETVRAQICEGLEFLGIEIDPALNAANEGAVSTARSRVLVRVIATDEEITIARAVAKITNSSAAHPAAPALL